MKKTKTDNERQTWKELADFFKMRHRDIAPLIQKTTWAVIDEETRFNFT